jgi:outer membrane biosynthesis protein TonB
MSKTSKASKKSETVTEVAAPVATPATPAPEVVKKEPKAKKAPKEVAPEPVVPVVEVVAEPTPTPAPAKKSKKVKQEPETPVVAEPTVVSVESVTISVTEPTSLAGDYSEFMGKLQQVSALLSMLKTEFRLLEKKSSRELRTATKASAKRKRKCGNRSPSGFVKPTLISDELAGFLSRPLGSQLARTDVTREINDYIRTHKLQHPENGRRINADEKLMALLKLKEGDELTYFNLQRYMSPHFAKSTPAVVVA